MLQSYCSIASVFSDSKLHSQCPRDQETIMTTPLRKEECISVCCTIYATGRFRSDSYRGTVFSLIRLSKILNGTMRHSRNLVLQWKK